MIDYYNNVYLSRINRFGNNLQERIINRKEYDFHHFVKKSPNRVTVFIQDFQFEGVLQTKTYDEIETIDYFLTYKSIPISNGAILKIRSIKDINEYSYWIIVARDNFTSAGYHRYTVVKLDREIRWITDEGLIFKALAHISGSGSGGTNRRLISSTKIVNESIVYMPNQALTIVMQDNEEIKRGVRINIGGIVWKISGYDNVTNDGVNYVTLEQDYFDESRDEKVHLDSEPSYQDGLADGIYKEKWTFDSDTREEIDENDNKWIQINKNETKPISFYASYFNKETQRDYEVEVEDSTVLKYNFEERSFTGLAEGNTKVIVRLVDSPDIEGIFYFQVLPVESEINTFSVEGAARIKCGIPEVFTSTVPFKLLNNATEDKLVVKDLNKITKNNKELYGLEITASQITKNLVLNFSGNGQTYDKIVNVESPWIGG